QQSHPFATSSHRQNGYQSTVRNLRIGSSTRVIFQGFTGRQATANAQESIAWGTNIVGGVTPGREGEHLGLPVVPTVRRAMDELKPNATGIYVPAPLAPAAIEEAIEAEVPLIVAVAEHVPLHDMLRIHSMLRTQDKSRLVGPNSPGIISAAEEQRCRIGFQPLPCFSAGRVGIASRSGTLSYEAVASTTRAGLGQSLCIGVGGDVLPGTDLVEALQVLEMDPYTEAIALIGEIGGDGEVLAAQWIKDYNDRTAEARRKPIVALVAGRQAPKYRVMGHAGAFWVPGEPDVKQKADTLAAVGVRLVNHPAKIGAALKEMLDEKARAAVTAETSTTAVPVSSTTCPRRPQPGQHRSLHLSHEDSLSLLREEKLSSQFETDRFPCRYLAIGIDRASRSQCILAAILAGEQSYRKPRLFHKILLPDGVTNIRGLNKQEWRDLITLLAKRLDMVDADLNKRHNRALTLALRDMATIFQTKEAKLVSAELDWIARRPHPIQLKDLRIDLDDAAYHSSGRVAEVHERYESREERVPGTAEAARHGIVYHRLAPKLRQHNIGTLVNGAGLAMNTVDALHDAGGYAANFLDTGGKATAETIQRSFEVILSDDRVKVIFVNIFGGLTRGDMIAEGIILAFKETDIKVPVVVRIRGTNEEEGQRIIAESGLPLYAFDDFDEAAAKAIELA
ncbi:hypothetical protein M406DRAFT_22569, partial [Cryphonectria parasitica EP155]